MLNGQVLESSRAATISVKLLAHLGDAVFDLFERQRQILKAGSARNLHSIVVSRVSAEKQAQLLDYISGLLTDAEADIVRRARNLKPGGNKRAAQADYRKATAFEALIGYLYLTSPKRLEQILEATVKQGLEDRPDP